MKASDHLIYLRKSQADDPNESVQEVLARHERQLQEYAVKTYGQPIPEDNIYREVVSGETIEDRPEIKIVLRRIEDRHIRGVLVIEPQRLTRGDLLDCGTIVHAFRYSRTVVVTPIRSYNLEDKFERKYFESELIRGNDFLEYTKEILKRGKIASIKEGNYIGSIAPYGYKKVKIDKTSTLAPNEDEVRILRLAQEIRLNEKVGWTVISRRLDAMGLKPRNGEYWNADSLRSICLNPVNIGLIKLNARKIVPVFENGKIRKTRPVNREVEYYPGKHPAITSQETFDALWAMEGKQPKIKAARELVNPLATLIFCKTCGRGMSYRTYKNKDGTYKCAPRLLCNNQVHCGTKSAEFSVVYEAVVSTLEQVVRNFKIEMKQDNTRSHITAQQKALEGLEDKLAKLEVRQEELYQFLEEKIYTKDVFLMRNKKLAEEREALTEAIKKTREAIPEPINYEEKIYTFTQVIEGLRDENVPAKQKNDLLKTIVSRIEYSRDSSNRTKWDDSVPEIDLFLK